MFAPKTVIEGLRGVGRVELNLQEGCSAYVLLGRNAVGKTKTLEALFQAALYAYVARVGGEGALSRPETIFDLVVCDVGGVRSPNVQVPFVKSIVDESLRDTALPCVFIGAQSRGFIGAEKKSAANLGTAEQRREAYVKSLLLGMQTNFTRLNMSGGIEQWFVVRAQSANPYQRQDDSRELEIGTVLISI